MASPRNIVAIILFQLPVSIAAQSDASGSSGFDRRFTSQHFGATAGIWLPTGSLNVLGAHPSVGFQWGFRHYQHEFNLSLDSRFVNSKNPYVVIRDDTPIILDSYFGGYLGVDYIYYIMVAQRVDLGVLSGIGYDGISLDREEVPSSPYEIVSLNLNLGLRFNYYTAGELYFSIQPRYNFINYGNKGGTDFSGNAFSVVFLIMGLL